MKIYIVERKDEWGYDEYDSWVVIASSPKEAKSLCIWGDGNPKPSDLTAREVKAIGKPRQVLGSFNAG